MTKLANSERIFVYRRLEICLNENFLHRENVSHADTHSRYHLNDHKTSETI